MSKSGEVRQVPIEQCLVSDDFNTRKKGPGDLTDLVESIKAKGVIEPILGKDRENAAGEIEIYAGFRRIAAAKEAGLTTVPVLVKNRRSVTRQQMLEFNIVENIHRQDLNPVDEAYGYLRMQEEHGMSVDEICTSVGVKKSRIEKRNRLLRLQDDVRDAVHEDRICMSSAFEIDRLPVEKQGKYLVIAEELSGHKLAALINTELEKMQLKAEKVVDEEPKPKAEPGVKTEHIRQIKQCSSVIAKGLGYDEDQEIALRQVDFRPLEDDDLTVVAKLYDDCADNVEPDFVMSAGAEDKVVEFVEGDQGDKFFDFELPTVRQALIAMIMGRAKELAIESAGDSRPRVTKKIVQSAIDEYFTSQE